MSSIYLPYQKLPRWNADRATVAYNCARLGLPTPTMAMPFWENAGRVHDYSGNEHHGELPASGVIWSNGLFGSCLKGNGGADDWVDTNWRWTFGTGPFTFMCWYKGTEPTSYAGFLGAATAGNLGAILMLNSNKLAGWINNNAYGGTSTVINDDEWHHLVFMRDGTTGRLYVDGVQDGSDFVVSGANINVAKDVRIFGWGHAGYQVAGLIDFPIIFDRALSSPQVRILYDNPSGMFEPVRGPQWVVPLGVTTAAPTTSAPTTIAPTTTIPATTSAPTTPTYTTIGPTTVPVATTPISTTVAPTTLAPTTIGPTPAPPTTLFQTTVGPTTKAPSTGPATTVSPTTFAPSTGPATTVPPTTEPFTTSIPTTVAPTTVAPTTLQPTTLAPTTVAPTTTEPTTLAPTTQIPTTLALTTLIPTTLGPTVPPTTNIPEAICIKELNSTITNEIPLRSLITKEIRFNGHLC